METFKTHNYEKTQIIKCIIKLNVASMNLLNLLQMLKYEISKLILQVHSDQSNSGNKDFQSILNYIQTN